MPAPPGAFPSPPPPIAPSKSSKKKAKKASKAAVPPPPSPPSPTDSASSLPPLEDVSAANAPASPNDLLSTASDLYRQIEAAAASALSTHPSFAASFPPPPNGTGAHPPTTDEAYWTSLPQHLRQFIRSALPLAAGLTGTTGGLSSDLPTLGPNGQLPPLTHEQLSSAAAQLAQVVQSNWGQLGLGPLPVPANGPPAAGGATISLGSFPVTMPTREQMQAAMAGGLGAGLGDANEPGREDDDEVFDLTDDEAAQPASGGKKKKKNKKKKTAMELVASPPPPPPPTTANQANPARRPSAYQPTVAPKAGPSSERERIRDFWLGLRENERRALVKVEKEAVLRKMKEQQRSGCSCAVCGRKRSAIEEELEVLYDAYYDELESYANHQVRYASSGGTIAPPPGPGPFPGSVDASTAPTPAAPAVAPASGKRVVRTTRDHKNVRPAAKKKSAAPPPPPPAAPAAPAATTTGKEHHHPGHGHNHHHGPAHGEPGHTHSTSCPHHPHNHGNGKAKGTTGTTTGKDVEEYDDEDEEEEYESDEDEGEEDDGEGEYDEDEEASDEADYDDEDEPGPDDKKALPAPPAKDKADADFFGFGKSLTVKGGILTVADDLLKNDGQKFLEMMEQLADKRIQREREQADESVGPDSDDDDPEGEDGEYESEGEGDEDEDEDEGSEDDEDDDDELMTEAERMEEGRRMFQIFAARMFEQRVLTAYREKVASEKQKQLLRELEEEERLAEEKELKKAKENQKKKDKKKDQKQKKEEERLKKEAEREAAELAQRQAEEQRIDEDRRRNEEQRVRREAERRLKDEERQRKEEKLRQAKEDERIKKEDKLRQAKEARLAQEKDQRERKARDDAERRAREQQEKRDRDEREEKERLERVERDAELERERQAAAAANLKAQAAAAAAARAKAQQQQQQQKPPTAPRGALGPNKAAVPGLPKQSLTPGPTPSSQLPPIVVGRQQGFPPGVRPSPVSPQQSRLPDLQRPAQQSIPAFLQRPQPGPTPNGQQGSRMFPPAGSQAFGTIGLQQQAPFMPHPQQQQHPVAHISPVMGRNAPIGPPPTAQPAPANGNSPARPNGVPVAPIGPPPQNAPSSANASPRGPSALASPTARPINIGPIGGTIGRPSSSVSSQRSSSPPPRIFGSSALHEDDEIVEPTSRNSATSWASAPFSPGIWGAPAVQQQQQQQAVTPDRNSVIRDRARVSYLKLDEMTHGTNGPIQIADIHRALITLWPDAQSVDLKELVESMLVEGSLSNGGGSFVFTQRGDALFAQYLS